MAIRTLSLVITDETRDEPALRAAVAIATREDAHLDLVCLGVEPVPLETVPMTATPVVMETWRVESRERAEGLAAWASSPSPARASDSPPLSLASRASRTSR
jgi:hypothetical protein